MDPIPVSDAVWRLPLPLAHCHLVRIDDGYAVIDAGAPGTAPHLLDGLSRLSIAPGQVRQIVLTHYHLDHTGALAELAAATGATVLAGAADAPVIRGDLAETAPVLAGDRQLYEQTMAGATDLDPATRAPCRVDVELSDGDELSGWGEPVRVLSVPGHTDGSIALHLPRSRVLFPGDPVAVFGGRAMLGPFNVDPDAARASFHRLAGLDVDTLCPPHGEVIGAGAAGLLRAATPDEDWR